MLLCTRGSRTLFSAHKKDNVKEKKNGARQVYSDADMTLDIELAFGRVSR
jgi:hypothetical protein